MLTTSRGRSPQITMVSFLLVTLATAALAAVASASPVQIQRRSPRDDGTLTPDLVHGFSGAAFTGTLYYPIYKDAIYIGENFTVNYQTTPVGAGEPHFPSSTVTVDFGLQGPWPMEARNNSWEPLGIRELAYGMETGGPGGWINFTASTASLDPKEGDTAYYLIVTEHQRSVYIEGQPLWSVQAYNVSLNLLTPASAIEQ
ncbi:hypothetical protein JCM8097_001265 [Rhodosporidiobolus ruineniae]